VEASVIRAPTPPGRILGAGPLLRLRADDQLVVLFRTGYDEAFEVIVARYKSRLLAYTRRMLGGSGADAEDATQEVFLSAYSALRHDDRPLMLRAWLYRIAHNRCIDQIRRPTPAPGDILDVSRAPQRDPVIESERSEKVWRIVRDAQRLPELQRSALLMREMEGFSYCEIASALGVTQKAVKSLLVRARMGLAAADEARNTPCADIRAELASAFDRGVRMAGRSKLHLHDCADCREYRARLRGLQRTLHGASAGHGVLATIAKLLGIGGAGSSAAVGAGTVAVGGPVVAKITALVCCGVAAAGVAEFKPHPTKVAPDVSHRRASRTAAPSTTTPTAAVLQHVDRRIPAAAAPAHSPAAAPAKPAAKPALGSFRALSDRSLYGHGTTAPKPTTPHEAARSTGGALAPGGDEPAPPRDTATTTRAAPRDPPSIAPPDPTAPDPPTAPAPDPPATAAAAPPAPDPQAAAPSGPVPTEPTGGIEAPGP
jgi:RNA polymerase sigma factor (sigma-70 family)